MRLHSHTFQKTRVVVAMALFLSVSAPFVQYACGGTGETTTTSTLVVKTAGVAPCESIPNGIHDRLCGESGSLTGCEGEACTTETVETISVARADLPQADSLPEEGEQVDVS